MESTPNTERQDAIRKSGALFFRVAGTVFVLGGVLWMWADLSAFDSLGVLTIITSMLLWVSLGWLPSMALGLTVISVPMILGRHQGVKRRVGLLFLAMSIGLNVMWCAGMDVPVDETQLQVDTAFYVRQIREGGEALNPGEVAPYLEDHVTPRSRYIALHVLGERRESLRDGDQWQGDDLIALEAAVIESLKSPHRLLREEAKATLIWVKLEGLEPGSMKSVLQDSSMPFADLSDWLTNWEREGRPMVEKRMNMDDFRAVQDWSLKGLPQGKAALQWSIEHDEATDAIAKFIGRIEEEHVLADIIRMFCSTEGWSPLVGKNPMTALTRGAILGAIDRMENSLDPLFQREANSHREWVLRQPQAQ